MTIMLSTEKVDEIYDYGSRFLGIINYELICRIEEVPAKILNLMDEEKYPGIKMSLLGKNSAVRGTLLPSGRKFIAVKINVLDEFHRHIYSVAELIFQHDSELKDEYIIKFDTYCKCTFSDDDIPCSSILNERNRKLSDRDLENLRDLLLGRSIRVRRPMLRFQHLVARRVLEKDQNIGIRRSEYVKEVILENPNPFFEKNTSEILSLILKTCRGDGIENLIIDRNHFFYFPSLLLE